MSTQLEFYRARAQDARADAEAATLDNVRERCLRAASAWDAMAERAERTDKTRARQEAEKLALNARNIGADQAEAPILISPHNGAGTS